MVLLSAIGSWVYLNQQQIAQKDRQLQQEKQLKEYEQEQLNKRNEENCTRILCTDYRCH